MQDEVLPARQGRAAREPRTPMTRRMHDERHNMFRIVLQTRSKLESAPPRNHAMPTAEIAHAALESLLRSHPSRVAPRSTTARRC